MSIDNKCKEFDDYSVADIWVPFVNLRNIPKILREENKILKYGDIAISTVFLGIHSGFVYAYACGLAEMLMK